MSSGAPESSRASTDPSNPMAALSEASRRTFDAVEAPQASRASENLVSFDRERWRAPERCPTHLKPLIEELVNALPLAWLDEPATGEVYASLEECEQRLRGFSLSKGFDIVRTGGGNRRVPAKRWNCVHHGNVTRNDRGLEDAVERNEEGQVISNRKRQATNCLQQSCFWSVRCSLKEIDSNEEAKGPKGFVLIIIYINLAFNKRYF